MLHSNKQFIIHFWAYRPKPLFCKFFLIEPQIDHFHVELGYFKPTRILSLLKINFFSTKLMNLVSAYPETWQTSFRNFTQIVSLRAYRRKKFVLLANFLLF